MKPTAPSVFDLPDNLALERDRTLIGHDQEHFSALLSSIEQSRSDTEARLAAVRKSTGRMGQEVMERDFEIHRLSARLR